MGLWSRFRDWNYRVSVTCYEAFFMGSTNQEREAYRAHQFAWLWLLIPIADIAVFAGIEWQHDMNRRSKRLEEEMKRLQTLEREI